MTKAEHTLERPGDCLRHGITLCMLVLWILNDHLFKELWGNAWTGKLSDFAGLAVFPLIPYSAYELGCALRGVTPRFRRAVLMGSVIATGTVMAGINLWDPWADAFRIGLGTLQWPFRAVWFLAEGTALPQVAPVFHTMDPTDLLMLPALGIPYWVVR